MQLLKTRKDKNHCRELPLQGGGLKLGISWALSLFFFFFFKLYFAWIISA